MKSLGYLLAVSMIGASSLAQAADDFIVVQSTTSTQNSGLYEYLLPKYTQVSGTRVRVVAVGTGQAIKNARNCDGDVLLVHAKADEQKFVRAGYGTQRANLMYNDFVLVGPKSDPAGVQGKDAITDALAAIAQSKSIFVSRGDDSGTHKAEKRLWRETEVDAQAASGTWYRETGSGMGATLNAASAMSAYALTDRATWISFANRGDLQIVLEGDAQLFNQYGVIPISGSHCPEAKVQQAQMFSDWLLSEAGQQAIAEFKVEGQQLFFPNAK